VLDNDRHAQGWGRPDPFISDCQTARVELPRDLGRLLSDTGEDPSIQECLAQVCSSPDIEVPSILPCRRWLPLTRTDLSDRTTAFAGVSGSFRGFSSAAAWCAR